MTTMTDDEFAAHLTTLSGPDFYALGRASDGHPQMLLMRRERTRREQAAYGAICMVRTMLMIADLSMSTSEAEALAAEVDSAGLTKILDRIVGRWVDGVRLSKHVTAGVVAPLLAAGLVQMTGRNVRSTTRGHMVALANASRDGARRRAS